MKLFVLPIILFLTASTGAQKIRVGEAYVQKGHPKRAVGILTDVLKEPGLKNDQMARASMALGLAYLQLQQPDQAIFYLDKSAFLKPKHEKTWLLMGMAHHEKDDISGAIESYMRGIEAQPKSVALHWELGTSLLMADRAKESVGYLNIAVKMEPYDAQLWADLAHAQVRIGAFEEARESGEQAISLNPDSHDAFYTLGDAWAGLGDREQARIQYRHAISREPMFVPALYRLALLAQADEMWGMALGYYAKTLSIEPDHLRAKGRLDASLAAVKKRPITIQTQAFEEAITIEEQFLQGYEELGELKAQQKEWGAAIKAYKKLATLKRRTAQINQKIRLWQAEKQKSDAQIKKQKMPSTQSP